MDAEFVEPVELILDELVFGAVLDSEADAIVELALLDWLWLPSVTDEVEVVFDKTVELEVFDWLWTAPDAELDAGFDVKF